MAVTIERMKSGGEVTAKGSLLVTEGIGIGEG